MLSRPGCLHFVICSEYSKSWQRTECKHCCVFCRLWVSNSNKTLTEQVLTKSASASYSVTHTLSLLTGFTDRVQQWQSKAQPTRANHGGQPRSACQETAVHHESMPAACSLTCEVNQQYDNHLCGKSCDTSLLLSNNPCLLFFGLSLRNFGASACSVEAPAMICALKCAI